MKSPEIIRIIFFMLLSALYTSSWWACAKFDMWATPLLIAPIVMSLAMIILLCCSLGQSFDDDRHR